MTELNIELPPLDPEKENILFDFNGDPDERMDEFEKYHDPNKYHLIILKSSLMEFINRLNDKQRERFGQYYHFPITTPAISKKGTINLEDWEIIDGAMPFKE